MDILSLLLTAEVVISSVFTFLFMQKIQKEFPHLELA